MKKEENVTNGKEESEKKIKVSSKEETDKKSKASNRDSKNKGKKNEETIKASVDENKKADEEDKNVTVDGDDSASKRRGRKPKTLADSEE